MQKPRAQEGRREPITFSRPSLVVDGLSQAAVGLCRQVEPLYHGPEGAAEDYFSGLDGDKTIQIDCSRWLHCDTPTTVELYGSEGALSQGVIWHWEDGQFAARESAAESDMPHTQPPADGLSFYHEIEHFARAVAGQVKAEVDAQDAYHFMQILDALYDSAQRREKVMID